MFFFYTDSLHFSYQRIFIAHITSMSEADGDTDYVISMSEPGGDTDYVISMSEPGGDADYVISMSEPGGDTDYVISMSKPGGDTDYVILFNIHVTLQKIKLEFIKFDIQLSINCSNDSVRLYDGEDDSAPWLGVFCGIFLRQYKYSSTNSMFVSFQSDSLETSDGFKMKYTAIVGCKYHFSEDIPIDTYTIVQIVCIFGFIICRNLPEEFFQMESQYSLATVRQIPPRHVFRHLPKYRVIVIDK